GTVLTPAAVALLEQMQAQKAGTLAMEVELTAEQRIGDLEGRGIITSEVASQWRNQVSAIKTRYRDSYEAGATGGPRYEKLEGGPNAIDM
ncbi:hypothetical protein NLU14_21930, partial [Marinobacter sp. 71-i]